MSAETASMRPEFPPVQTRVAGVSFENRDGTLRQTFVRQVRRGDALRLRREPENPFDPHAIAVDWPDADGVPRQLGYVPRALAFVLAGLVDRGASLAARVVRKGGGGLRPAGVTMAIDLEPDSLPASAAAGLAPALARALEADRLEAAPDAGNAPALGGDRLRPPPGPHDEAGPP